MRQESENDRTIVDLVESFFNSSNLNDLEGIISIYEANEIQQTNIENKILFTINYLFQGRSYNIEDVKKFLIIYDKFTSLKKHNFLYRNLVEIAVEINEKEVFDKCFEKILAFGNENSLFSNNHLDVITGKFQVLINKLQTFNINFFNTPEWRLLISKILFYSFYKQIRNNYTQTEESKYITNVLTFLSFLSSKIKIKNIYNNIIQNQIINVNESSQINCPEELLSIIETISDDQISFSLTKEFITTIFELFISNNDNTNIKQELQKYCENIISEGENEHNNRTNMDPTQNNMDNVIQDQDNIFVICSQCSPCSPVISSKYDSCFVSRINGQEDSAKTENNTNYNSEQDNNPLYCLDDDM